MCSPLLENIALYGECVRFIEYARAGEEKKKMRQREAGMKEHLIT